jgi:hypothetical protein
MTAADYHDDPCPRPSLSSTLARAICLESPLHAHAGSQRLNPEYTPEEKEHFDIGTAAHAVLLEGVDVVAVIDAKDWRTNAAKDARDAARAAGKIPLLTHVATRVVDMVKAARLQLAEHTRDGGAAMFTGGIAEQVAIWRDGASLCRARLDYLRPIQITATTGGWAIDDYKTARDANPDNWIRSMFRYGYDLQAAWYQHGVQEVQGGELAEFRFCVQETSPPYALSVVALNPDAWTLAEKKRIYALEVWERCVSADRWPGYPPRTCYAQLPQGHENWWLDREQR